MLRVLAKRGCARSVAVMRPTVSVRLFSDDAEEEMDPKAIQAIVDAKVTKANQTGEH